MCILHNTHTYIVTIVLGDLCDNIGVVGVSAKWSYVTASPSHHDKAIPIFPFLKFEEFLIYLLYIGSLDWVHICRTASKVVTFIDLAGHEKYLKTTIFGMTGHAPDFCMLMVGSNAGIIGMTKGGRILVGTYSASYMYKCIENRPKGHSLENWGGGLKSLALCTCILSCESHWFSPLLPSLPHSPPLSLINHRTPGTGSSSQCASVCCGHKD